MADVQVIHGDCLDVLPTLTSGSVDAVVTDPPYGIGFRYLGYDDTRDNLRRLIAAALPHCRRIAKRVYVLPGITQIHLYPEPDWTACITWNTTGSFGKYGFTQWMPVLCYGPDVPGFARLPNGVLKSDVIAISGGAGVGFNRSKEEKQHTCPKPANLMRKLICRVTAEGDTVLDPFAGSGSTGVACVQTGRRFLGIEREAAYVQIARRRIAAAQAEHPLFAEGAANGQ